MVQFKSCLFTTFFYSNRNITPRHSTLIILHILCTCSCPQGGSSWVWHTPLWPNNQAYWRMGQANNERLLNTWTNSIISFARANTNLWLVLIQSSFEWNWFSSLFSLLKYIIVFGQEVLEIILASRSSVLGPVQKLFFLPFIPSISLTKTSERSHPTDPRDQRCLFRAGSAQV